METHSSFTFLVNSHSQVETGLTEIKVTSDFSKPASARSRFYILEFFLLKILILFVNIKITLVDGTTSIHYYPCKSGGTMAPYSV